MEPDLWIFEQEAAESGYVRVAGVDEAGRGPLAGPVVAAAVVLPKSFAVIGPVDSKKLTQAKREYLYDRIYREAEAVGIGLIDPTEIDRVNILNAALSAMAMAVDNLIPKPDFILVDGTFTIPSFPAQRAVPKGDSRSISIGCASIVAKVTRDRLMNRYHEDYPCYGFSNHKGYPTRDHREAIMAHGGCMIHRKSFKGVCESKKGRHGLD
jgi:ribonuclease HII